MKVMKGQVLSVSQMNHLIELGVDTRKASCYIWESEGKEYLYWGKCEDANGIPIFTLQDILELLPTVIKHEDKAYYLTIGRYVSLKESWYVRYSCNGEELQYKVRNDLLEVAYEMLCWCIENVYLKVKEG